MFSNKNNDLLIEFVTRIEGIHKIYLYFNNELIDDNPFLIYVNSDSYTINSLSSNYSRLPSFKSYLNSLASSKYYSISSSNNDISGASNASFGGLSHSDSQVLLSHLMHPYLGYGTVQCGKTNEPFHLVMNKNYLSGLIVYGKIIFFAK
jgi:hypothetical protein